MRYERSDRERASREQAAQIAIALFADTAKLALAPSGSASARTQPKPRGPVLTGPQKHSRRCKRFCRSPENVRTKRPAAALKT